MSPTKFGQFIASETEKSGKVSKFAALKAERTLCRRPLVVSLPATIVTATLP
jgi:hypothetical protein